MNNKAIWSKLLMYFIGLNILSVGTVMSQYGKLGVGALTSFPQILSLATSISIGEAMGIFFLVIIAIEFILLRKIQPQIFLQLGLALVFSALVDFDEFHLGLQYIQVPNFSMKLILTLLSIILTSIGIFIMVKADFILMPTDGLVRLISKLTRSKFGFIKFGFDFSSIMAAIILSFFALGHVVAIGIGTVAAVIMVGQLINLLEVMVNKIQKNNQIIE